MNGSTHPHSYELYRLVAQVHLVHDVHLDGVIVINRVVRRGRVGEVHGAHPVPVRARGPPRLAHAVVEHRDEAVGVSGAMVRW